MRGLGYVFVLIPIVLIVSYILCVFASPVLEKLEPSLGMELANGWSPQHWLVLLLAAVIYVVTLIRQLLRAYRGTREYSRDETIL